MKYFLCLFINLAGITAIGQPSYKAIVADSLSHKPLPFATVRAERQNTQLAGVDGSFRILMRETGIRLKISYVGYVSRDLFIEARPGSPDTIFLMPAPSNLNEITVIPDNESGESSTKRFETKPCMIRINMIVTNAISTISSRPT